MHPIHVEPIDRLPSRWLVPGVQRPNLPGGEVVSESMLLVFPNSIQILRGEPDLRVNGMGESGDLSLIPAIGQIALKISDRVGLCPRWLGRLTF